MNPAGCRLIGVFSVAFACASTAQAVTIELKNSWMRPAAAGSIARVYVDIISDTELTLVGAASTNARKAELVKVGKLDGSDEGSIVKSMPVAANEPTRLAYHGSYVRLIEIKKDLPNGAPVSVTLQFRDKTGKRYTATTAVQVRGIVLRREGLPEDSSENASVGPLGDTHSSPAAASARPAH